MVTQDKPTLNVLILGGYGQAGRTIAELLADRIGGRITLAGRSMDKAEAAADKLRKNPPVDVSFDALALDINVDGALANVAFGYDVIIACLPLRRAATQRLVDACIEGAADCVDISAGTAKYEVFDINRDRIAASNQRFVIDAGADPGLPGWVAHYAASLVEAPTNLVLFARYQARSIGAAGVRDILDQFTKTPLAYEGAWKKAGWWKAKIKRFPGGFGRAVALPLYLNELQNIPAETGLEKLQFFHAGINLVTDALTLVWIAGLSKLISEERAARWFDAATRFTPKPTGISFHARIEGSHGSVTVDLWHHDLYRATASIAVLAVLGLCRSRTTPGLRFLWQHVRHHSFADLLESEGFALC